MKKPWILPAAALALGMIGGFITAKNNFNKAVALTEDSANAIQTRASGNRRTPSAENLASQQHGTRATSIDDIYRAPGNLSRLENLMRFYGGLTTEQLRDEAMKLNNLPLNERMPASFLLFARWAEMDPYGAMEFSNSMGMGGAFVRPTILQSWASVDPENAARYFSANPGQFTFMNMGRMMGGGQDAAEIIATEWARQDPHGAITWASTLAQGKAGALAAVLGEVAKSDPQKATEMLDQLAPGDRADAYTTIAARYGAKDFNAADAWIRTLPQDQQSEAFAAAIQGLAAQSPAQAVAQISRMPEGDAKNQLIPSLIGPLARTDPQAAAALINAQSDSGVKRDSMRELMPAWTSQDPSAALAFAREQETGPVYDRAMTSFITNHNMGNPADMIRLAETIGNERERGWSVGFTAQRWMQSEPLAARAYLEQSEAISDGMRQRILDGRPIWGQGRDRRR